MISKKLSFWSFDVQMSFVCKRSGHVCSRLEKEYTSIKTKEMEEQVEIKVCLQVLQGVKVHLISPVCEGVLVRNVVFLRRVKLNVSLLV